SAPWTFAKENNMEAIKLIMADLLEVLRKAAIMLYPVMPTKMSDMWAQLGLDAKLSDIAESGAFKDELENRSKQNERKFSAGTKVAKGDPLFLRIK
ncbi:MAG: hypothetical protein HQL29_05660, partial [Candidatus Omnitrophica bacterium]|nr:hypothetical protein [Candidatus Omnitrophota bacterium]